MSLRELYEAFGDETEAGAVARRLIGQQHWFNSLAEFDPKTGRALPLGLDQVLRRLAEPPETGEVRDRLWRIAEHCRGSVASIFSSLTESPRREQATMPIREVRELSAGSLIALNRRPGRNIREKLAGHPYMQAVRRFQSIDLPENRLLKEFVTQLAELLEMRAKHLHVAHPLLTLIERWLHSHDAEAIGRWGNLPPNNTLLSHKDYRRVWDAWRWLQALDLDTESDIEQAEARTALIEEWQGYAKRYSSGAELFGGMPVLFNHEDFDVHPWLPRPASRSVQAPIRSVAPTTCSARAVAVDLTTARPRFAVEPDESHELADVYVWQRWQNDSHGVVDIGLFEADFPLLWRESTTISSPDLFFRQDLDPSLADVAGHAFSRRLRASFSDAALTWLIPDHLSEFDLGVLRRNLNARFPSAEPLPRSVAAVFDQVEHRAIKGEGFSVLVVDTAGGVLSATRLVARIDPELAERVPATRGYFWERTPCIVLGSPAEFDPLADVAHVGIDGQWRDATSGSHSSPVSKDALRANPLIEPFDKLIQITTSPVTGGVKAQRLQHSAADIAIWRDHIPALSIKVHMNGHYQPFHLVDEQTTIRPIRGLAVRIPVAEQFTLPAGKDYYQFPLFQGSDASDVGYVARIDSPNFPLANDTTCHLEMTYTYGADEPYRLVLNAPDGSMPPVHVKWRPKSEYPVTEAPAPGYPVPLTWHELQHNYFAPKSRWDNLLKKIIDETAQLVGRLEDPSGVETTLERTEIALRSSGTVDKPWREDRRGKLFTTVAGTYLAETDLGDGLAPSDVGPGTRLYFNTVDREDFSKAVNASTQPSTVRVKKVKRRVERPVKPGTAVIMYRPYIKVWADGRSITDFDCPQDFGNKVKALGLRLHAATAAPTTSAKVRDEIRFLFCCMHRDMPSPVSQELLAAATADELDERAYAFALGDLSQSWQYDIFRSIWSRADALTLGVFSQAIWRTSDFVRVFDAPSLDWLSSLLLQALREVNAVLRPGKGEISRATQYGELLLGLLRSRDSEITEVRQVLQPYQERTKLLADELEQVVGLVERSGLTMRSRVEIVDLPDKPLGDTTPDLLYALRLYLTGDDGANAIRVTGVLDGEDDHG